MAVPPVFAMCRNVQCLFQMHHHNKAVVVQSEGVASTRVTRGRPCGGRRYRRKCETAMAASKCRPNSGTRDAGTFSPSCVSAARLESLACLPRRGILKPHFSRARARNATKGWEQETRTHGTVRGRSVIRTIIQYCTVLVYRDYILYNYTIIRVIRSATPSPPYSPLLIHVVLQYNYYWYTTGPIPYNYI